MALWWDKIKNGLKKTSAGIVSALDFSTLDDDVLDALEESFILSDMGVKTATSLRLELEKSRVKTAQEARDVLKKKLYDLLDKTARPFQIDKNSAPYVILMVGVNGAGKTTTIAKMASDLKEKGLQVAFGAVDTFRMAAIEQLQEWGKRTGCAVYAKEKGADPAAAAFDAYQQAISNKDDVLFLDTAGRLQNKAELMAELEKIIRVIKKINPEAPHQVLLVLDATVGQNALSQVSVFKNSVDVSGIIMTKLDGTAKGGVLIALAEQFNLPIYYIGVGEKASDLQPFNHKFFVDGLLGNNPDV